MKKWMTLGAGMLILVLMGTWWFLSREDGNQNAQRHLSTAPVMRGDLTVSVSGSGTISAPDRAAIKIRETGKAAEILVKQGDSVEAGQALIRYEGTDKTTAIQQEKINLEQKQINLKDARQALTSLQKGTEAQLLQNNVKRAKLEVEQAEEALKLAKTETDSNGAQLAVAKNIQQEELSLEQLTEAQNKWSSYETGTSEESLRNTIKKAELEIQQVQEAIANLQSQQAGPEPLTAAISGIITSLDAAAGDALMAGNTAGEIVSYSRLQSALEVDELDIPKIKTGQTANVTIEALPGRNFTGKVSAIAREGTATNGVSLFEVVVTLDETEGILAGMTAQTEIIAEERTSVLTVPIEAVRTMRSQSFVTVAGTVVDKETGQPAPTMKQIEVGLNNEMVIEIVQGLEEGELVILPEVASGSSAAPMQAGGFGMFPDGAGGFPGGGTGVMPGGGAGGFSRGTPGGQRGAMGGTDGTGGGGGR